MSEKPTTNNNTAFVSHPLIKENTVEARLYQQVLAVRALEKGNTLIVAPTGLGKTAIALLVAAERLKRFPDGKVLFLAPTKPLVDQHYSTFSSLLKNVPVVAVSGSIPPDKREKLYKEHRVIIATPQTVENDLLTGKLSLEDVVLLVVDEAHRAVGNYPYVFIAKEYMKQSKNPLILAITASPGGDPDRIREVIENLYIKNVEIKTPYDPDVRPYVHKILIEWKVVELPEAHKKIIKLLKDAIRDRLRTLKEYGIVESTSPDNFSRKELLNLQKQIAEILKERNVETYWKGLSLVAEIVKIDHALELAESQGTKQFVEYIERLRLKQSSSADKSVVEDERVKSAYRIASELLKEGYIHEKVKELTRILSKYIKDDKKAIVFVQFRDTASVITDVLSKVPGLKPVRFVGQATRTGEKGMTQKEQKKVIEDFRKGKYNVLVSTSVAEEGLDIPAVDLVVFYEPVPSEIRFIQRRGRTGRFSTGRVVVLISKGTRDEAYYWSAKIKERRMIETLNQLKKFFGMEVYGQRSIIEYVEEEKKPEYIVEIIADQRERGSDVFRLLISDKEVSLKTMQLDVGDYIVSDRIAIERKSYSDFINSIIDGRLFTQAQKLVEVFPRPILVIEKTSESIPRNVHPNAVRGAIASLAADYGIPVIITEGPYETYELIKIMARREQLNRKRLPRVRGEKRLLSLPEMQRFIVESLPGVGPKLARELLKRFKTVEHVFIADERELAKVEGIGEKRAKEIRKVLTAEYKEEEDRI